MRRVDVALAVAAAAGGAGAGRAVRRRRWRRRARRARLAGRGAAAAARGAHRAGPGRQGGRREAVPDLQPAGGRQAGLGQRRLRDRGREVGGAAARARPRSRDREGDPAAGARGARARRRAAVHRCRPSAAAPPEPPPAPAAADADAEPRRRAGVVVSVSGTVSGGGAQGPGGAVVWLKRVGGETPRPAPARGKVVTQRNKTFIPHVLAVPVGTKVSFRNEDAIFHNVFSLSKPNDFDTGLYKQGATYTQTFKRAGRRPDPVQHPLVDAGLHLRRRHAVLRAGRRRGRVHDQGRAAGRLRDRRCGTRRRRSRPSSASASAPDGARGLALQVGGDKRAARSSSPTSRASPASPTSGIDGCHRDRVVGRPSGF